MPVRSTRNSRQLRTKMLDARRALSPAYRAAASDAICRKLVRSRQFERSTTIAVYFAQEDEVDLSNFVDAAWQSGKRVFAPIVAQKYEMFFSAVSRNSDLRRNRYGIWEVEQGEIITAEQLDWVLLPIVAFDAAMHRIGMGSGYYDRAFAFRMHRHRVLKPRMTGVAFACQETASIARNPWDIGVSRVFTEF